MTITFQTYTFWVQPGGGANSGAIGSSWGFEVTNGFAIVHYFSPTNGPSGTNSDGANPVGRPIVESGASDGKLYGTARDGGATGNGTVYFANVLIATPPTNNIFVNLHSFSAVSGPDGTNSDGAHPIVNLTRAGYTGTDGSYARDLGDTLYGMTSAGGAYGQGTIFSMKTDGSGFKTLHSFAKPADATIYFPELYPGGPPYTLVYGSTNSDGLAQKSGLTVVGDTLYGTSSAGGAYGNGNVFGLKTDGSRFTVLHDFSLTMNTNALDQGNPNIFGVDLQTNLDGKMPTGSITYYLGVLYGTASHGGTNFYDYNQDIGQRASQGTAYKITIPPSLSAAIPPSLTFTRSGTNLVMNFPGGSLEMTTALYGATSLNGSWSNLSTNSPYTNAMSGAAQFFRVGTTINLSSTHYNSGQ